MDVITANWKSNILCQLQQHNRQQNGYDKIINEYDRILENNGILKIQCFKLERDVNQLRLTNAGLERASAASQELGNVNNKLTEANEEVLLHLREKDELAREVRRLYRALTDANEKFVKEELKAEEYKTQNEQLHEQIQKAEFEVNDLLQTNQVLREEFQAIQIQVDQLNIDYNGMKPTCLELEQQLTTAKRMNQRLEEELIVYKNQQAERHDFENTQFIERLTKQVEPSRQSEPSVFVDDDLVIISTAKSPSNANQDALYNSHALENSSDPMYSSYMESLTPNRRGNKNVGNLFSSFMRKITDGMGNSNCDRLNRTSTCCFAASVPTREINQWACTDLEVYSLKFQPSGSILATGCSDKMVHLWEISAGGQERKYCSLQGSHGAINALDFDNEGGRLLAGCSGHTAYIWSYGEHRMLKDTYNGHKGLVSACKFISTTKLATGSADRTIKLWDLYGRQCTQTLFVGSKCHDLVIIDAAGTMISGHFDKKIRVWDQFSDKCRSEMKFDAAITSLSYNSDRQQLLACLRDDTLKLIELRQNRTLYTFSHDNFKVSTDTTKAILSPDGRYICAGSHDGSVLIWDTETRECQSVLKQKHGTMVTSVAWQPDGKFVASCEKHRQVILWSD